MNYKEIKEKNLAGFTLVELLASVAIFSLIIGGASGVFISAIRTQRKTLSNQELLSQTSYLIEYMSRALRMAKKELDDPPICLSERGLNYEKTRGAKGLKFINHQGICQEFFWDVNDNRLKENKTGYAEPLPLTSSNLEIVSFNIELRGEEQDDDNQPRVTLFLKIKGAGEKAEIRPEIQIQTTVSQRQLDIQY
jgi:prepilin-type N-terminal cleavage/methylation domain-containing protein